MGSLQTICRKIKTTKRTSMKTSTKVWLHKLRNRRYPTRWTSQRHRNIKSISGLRLYSASWLKAKSYCNTSKMSRPRSSKPNCSSNRSSSSCRINKTTQGLRKDSRCAGQLRPWPQWELVCREDLSQQAYRLSTMRQSGTTIRSSHR